MKFALAQLRKLPMPYSFDESLDLSEELDGFEDIISSKLINVSYKINERGVETYSVSFHAIGTLILEDSVSLEEIPYDIDVEGEEVYTTDSSNEDAFIIEGQTLDTKEAIITCILENKPMSTTNHEFEDDIEDEDEEEEYVNPAFASLKDLLK